MSDVSQPVPTVFIIDDDASVRRYLSRLVRLAGMEALVFPTAEDFLNARTGPPLHPACLVLDLQMPGIGGLQLQRELASDPAPCPAIFISGNADIPSTVKAMKQGATNFLTKPFESGDLMLAIGEALETHRRLLASAAQARAIRANIDRLTVREREVMAWVIRGSLNKQIAGELGIAEQTVKLHRGRVMEKMRTVSVADLVRLCARASFEPAGNTKVQ